MADLFDPYNQWLGIPPEEQPPHYYRLLGLGQFEPDPRTIAAAADQVTYHLRGYQLGPSLQYAQKLLLEVAVAKACLLDPPKKAAYDQQLGITLAARQSALSGGVYPAPFGEQLSPERPLAPPPPPPSADGFRPSGSVAREMPVASPHAMQPLVPSGGYAPPSGYGPAATVPNPAVSPYASQPIAPAGGYSPHMQTAPMAYPPGMGPAPSPFPQATAPVPTGYAPPPFNVPSGFPVNHPPVPASYPGSMESGGAVSAVPPPAEESPEDDLAIVPTEPTAVSKRRGRLRREKEEKSYLLSGVLGAVLVVMVYAIIMFKHPIDRLFFDPPETPAAPVVKPQPPAPADMGAKHTPANRKPGSVPPGSKSAKDDKIINRRPGDLRPGDMRGRSRGFEDEDSKIPPLNIK